MTLELKQANITLGDRDFNFTLSAGANEVHAMLGKSGSGKSTLLNLIGGFLKPASGAIDWNQKSLLPLPPEQRPVTTLFQSHNLFEHLSARRNIALGVSPKLKLNAQQWIEIDAVLEDVGLAGRGDERPENLSGGEQQRVGLARCLSRKRPILLLDEPYGALDEATRNEMLTLTKQVIEQHQLCVLLVTHNADDALSLNAINHTLKDGAIINREDVGQ